MIDFNAHPDRYHHWRLTFDGPVARLEMVVDPDHPFAPGKYELKLNSYDLGVDIELQDAVQRVRFEHPETKVLVVTSGRDRVFCAGANIPMLATSPHAFKVNFCKFTNETRLSLEDASRTSGIKTIAALNGTSAGGGYELAISCDEIYLVDDGNSVVSLPEVPLLGVLPGTGGLTRLVDKRKIRRDQADMFSTLAEGVKGKRAKAWSLIDDYFPKSRFAEKVQERALALAKAAPDKAGPGIQLRPIEPQVDGNTYAYEFVRLEVDPEQRLARLTVTAPSTPQPTTPAQYASVGDQAWAVKAFRELDDALLHLRFEHSKIGLVLLHTRGDIDAVLAVEKNLVAHQDHWLVREVIALMARVLRRYELTAKSFFALAEQGSCFAGSLLELALAGDRIYALDDPDQPVELAVGPMSGGALPMSHGLTRLQSRFLRTPAQADKLAKEMPRLDAAAANDEGLVTVLADAIDWDDEVRLAIEERLSLSPDALTGMEASLRFGGAETCDSKIFGRLSAWQNWIFIRPNAVGPEGALTRYGQPEPARFDWSRT
ncbi:MAG: 2,3-epoxybenzoyl-CoA dihydrolase [Planctomycetota bacterium]